MRLIDATALERNVLKWMPSDPCGREEKEMPFETDIVVSLMMEIQEAPTIDINRPQGEWEYDPNGMDWNIPAWRCSECGYVATHIGIADKGIGSNPMNWAGSKYCPQCGCKIVGARTRGGK